MAPHLVNLPRLPTRARLCGHHVRTIVEHGRQMTGMRLPGERRTEPETLVDPHRPTTGRSDHGKVAHARQVYQAAPSGTATPRPGDPRSKPVLRGNRRRCRSTTPPGLPRPGRPPSHVHAYGRRTPSPERTTRTASPELLPARSYERLMTCAPAAPRSRADGGSVRRKAPRNYARNPASVDALPAIVTNFGASHEPPRTGAQRPESPGRCDGCRPVEHWGILWHLGHGAPVR